MSSEAIDKAAQTQIDNTEKNTGKKFKDWIAIVNKSGFEKHGELVKFLKEKHGFTHGNANMVVHYAKQSHAGASKNKKARVSLRHKKQFAIIQPSTKTRMDLGLNIKGTAPSGIAEPSGNWNTMCTHRIKIEDENAINKDMVNWIKMAYDEAG